MRYSKILLLTIISSFAFMQDTQTEPDPATDPATDSNAVEKKVESIKNLLINPCEGLNEEDCMKTEGCEFNAEDKVCSQSEVVPDTQTADTEDSTPIEFKDEYVVTVDLGGSLPFGSNIKEAYSMGPNISAKVITPFGMSLGANELKVAALLEISNHAASLSDGMTTAFNITSGGMAANMNLGSISTTIGFGLAMASGDVSFNTIIERDPVTNEIISVTPASYQWTAPFPCHQQWVPI